MPLFCKSMLISIKVDQGLKLGGDWEPKVRNYTLYLEKSGKRWYVESCVAKAKSEEVLKQWWKEKPFKNSKGQDEDIVFDGITNELKAYPYDYGSKDAKEDGLVCSSAMGTDNIEDLDSFIKSTSAGRKDEITIWSYGTDSGPFFTKIIYDGERYFAVFDHTRDTFGPRGYEKGVYTYLKQLEYETESTKPHTCVVLTDNKDLDYEKYREEINLRQTFLIIDYEK